MQKPEEFKPLYEELINCFGSEKWNEKIYPFFIQEGKHFQNSNKKILFVGKSVNGWVTNSTDIDIIFYGDFEGKRKIVNRTDEMRWVVKPNAKRKGVRTYKHSSFWRLIHFVTKSLLSKDKSKEWYDYIAWSNLYKISPKKGNPTDEMKKLQQKICCKILDKEIEILHPEFIVFLTSGWEKFYINHLGLNLSSFSFVTWGKKNYKIKYHTNAGITYILSQHPQGKPEKSHGNKIVEIINLIDDK
jgi:uracil-DNA glycosylase